MQERQGAGIRDRAREPEKERASLVVGKLASSDAHVGELARTQDLVGERRFWRREAGSENLVNCPIAKKVAKLLKRRRRFGSRSLPVIISECGKLEAIITK